MKGFIGKCWLALCLMLATHVACATVTYVYTDPQGTPLAEANASGVITATFDYSPYGRRVMGNPTPGPGYTGHVEDPDTPLGLIYMQARYYDPVAGRFLSVDPVGPSSGNVFSFNRYDYASNNPIKDMDVDGRASCESERCWSGRLMEATGLAALKSEANGFVDSVSGVVNGDENKAGLNVTGLLTGKLSVAQSATAAFGGGPHEQLGLINSSSSAGVTTPALGTAASIDANILTVSYKISDAPTSGALMTFGAEFHAIPGGRVSFSYEPPDKFSLAVDGGIGVGTPVIQMYSVEAKNDFSLDKWIENNGGGE